MWFACEVVCDVLFWGLGVFQSSEFYFHRSGLILDGIWRDLVGQIVEFSRRTRVEPLGGDSRTIGWRWWDAPRSEAARFGIMWLWGFKRWLVTAKNFRFCFQNHNSDFESEDGLTWRVSLVIGVLGVNLKVADLPVLTLTVSLDEGMKGWVAWSYLWYGNN